MEFSPIVPTDQLEKYLSKRKVWFALAHACLDNTYGDFYALRPDEVTLILDNGAYEGQLKLAEYIATIKYLKPTVAVLPDLYLGDAERSLYLSLGFLEQCGLSSHTYTNEWMFVPQAKPGDVDGFVRAAFTALKDPRITWLGIPRCLVTDISTNPLARVNFAEAIKKDYPNLNLHALGMINGNVHELYYLQKVGVRSCDSSAPYNHGDPDKNMEEITRCLNTP